MKLNRFKYINKELDFTIIEILKKDKIKKYLELDEYIESRDYEKEQIFLKVKIYLILMEKLLKKKIMI